MDFQHHNYDWDKYYKLIEKGLLQFTFKPHTPQHIKNKFQKIVKTNLSVSHLWDNHQGITEDQWVSRIIFLEFQSSHTDFFYNQLLPHVTLSRATTFFPFKKDHIKLAVSIIPSITFQNLESLYLTKGEITTLQFLNFLNVQKLQELFLHGNPITILKPMAKTRWSRLKMLDLKSTERSFHEDHHITRAAFIKQAEQFSGVTFIRKSYSKESEASISLNLVKVSRIQSSNQLFKFPLFSIDQKFTQEFSVESTIKAMKRKMMMNDKVSEKKIMIELD